MATLTPALDERPPGPASVARFGVTRGRTVENARRWGTAPRLANADNMVSMFVCKHDAACIERTLSREMAKRD